MKLAKKLGDNKTMSQHSITARVRNFSPLTLILISAAVAIVGYLQALDFPFVYDDLVYIPENTKLIELHATKLWHLFIEPYNNFSEFLPLRDFSYWLEITFFGLTPSAFRVDNILLYLFCLPLLYAVTLNLWRYFRPADIASAAWAAAAVTALFALHPALVESVVWISGRKYVLPNLFAMLTLFFAIKAKRELGFSTLYAMATLVAFSAVMLSKSSYVSIAPVVALLWVLYWCDMPAVNRHRLLLLWPIGILVAALLLVRMFIVTSIVNEPFYFGVESVTRMLAILGWLVRLSFSPVSRHLLYPVFEDPYLPGMVALGGAVVVVAIVGGVFSLRKRSLEGFALVAFLLICFPYLQFIPYAPPSLVSDRYLALSVWPMLLLLVALAWRLKLVLRIPFLLLMALAWGYQTVERTSDWRSFKTLIDADARAYPNYYMPAYYKIANFQLPQELYDEAKNTVNDIALREFREVMLKMVEVDHAVYALSTNHADEVTALLWQMGLSLRQLPAQAQWDSSIKALWEMSQVSLANEWSALAKKFPDDVLVRYSYGLWLLSIPKYELAAEEFHAVIDSNQMPAFGRGAAFNNFGLALMNSGHIIEAEDSLRAALEQTPPDLRAYCHLAELYRRTGKVKDAARTQALCRKQ